MVRRKSRGIIVFLLISIILLTTGCAKKNTEKQLTEIPIDRNNVMNIIEDLTSEKYRGRLTGTEENLLAGDYISEYFENLGLVTPKGIEGYKQWYIQKTRLIHSTPELSIVDDTGKDEKSFEYIKDFIIQTSSMQRLKGDVINELVIIEDAKFTDKDIRDKTILIKDKVFNELINLEEFTTALMTSDLKGIIIAVDTSNREYFGVTPYVLEDGDYSNMNTPFVLNVNMKLYEVLSQAAENNQQIRISADFSVEGVRVPNIVGAIKGSSEECIVIGAHFDHVGDNMNGTYNPGALDNASGTSTIMEVARMLKAYGNQPKKTIIFIAFNGEEQLAYGSKYYVSDPLYPLASTVMINVDTVGSKEELALQIEGYKDSKTEIVQEFEKIAKNMGIKYNVSTSSGTDHSSFGEKNVEVVNLIHPDFNNGYHSPADTIDNIKVENIEKVIKLIINYLNEEAYYE